MDSKEDITLEFKVKEMKENGVKQNAKIVASTAGTGGGGDSNFIYTPKRSIKKKDFKSRMQMIKTQSSPKQILSVKVLK